MPRRVTSICWRGVRLRWSQTKDLSAPSLALSSATLNSGNTPASSFAASSASSTWLGLAKSENVARLVARMTPLRSVMSARSATGATTGTWPARRGSLTSCSSETSTRRPTMARKARPNSKAPTRSRLRPVSSAFFVAPSSSTISSRRGGRGSAWRGLQGPLRAVKAFISGSRRRRFDSAALRWDRPARRHRWARAGPAGYRSARPARRPPAPDRDVGAPDRRVGSVRSNAPIRRAAAAPRRGRAGSGDPRASTPAPAPGRDTSIGRCRCWPARSGPAIAGGRCGSCGDLHRTPGEGIAAFGAAQARGAGARIAGNLIGARRGLVARAAPEAGRAAGAGFGQISGGLRVAARAFAQEGLYPAILQRMEGNHGQTPARRQQRLGGGKAGVQLAQLVVHRDAQGLEGAGGGIALIPPALAHHPAHDIGEFACARDGRSLVSAKDGPRDGSRPALLAVAEDDVRQFLFAAAVHQIGGAGPLAAHSHIQGPIGAERETTGCFVDLHGGDAEVQRDAVGGVDAVVGQQALHLAEAALDQHEAAGEALDRCRARCNGAWIAVDAPDPAIGGFQNGMAVAAGPVGAVDIDAAVARRQQAHHLGQQHRAMFGGLRGRGMFRRAHLPSVPGRRGSVRPFSSVRRRASTL